MREGVRRARRCTGNTQWGFIQEWRACGCPNCKDDGHWVTIGGGYGVSLEKAQEVAEAHNRARRKASAA